MKFPYRLRPNPAGKKALVHTTNQVLVAAALAIGYWLTLADDKKAEILVSLGLNPYHLALYTLIAVVVAGLLAKNTSIQKVPPKVEAMQNCEDPDHEG